MFHNTKNFFSYPKAKKFTYLGCTCSKHPLFKDLVESGAKETVDNFIYQELAGTATMHNEIIEVSWSMNAQGDDDTDPDRVPDQVSGAVEDELDGDLLENE